MGTGDEKDASLLDDVPEDESDGPLPFDCGVCLCDYDEEGITRLPCGHFLCKGCMIATLEDAINNGRCSSMTCHHYAAGNVKCPEVITAEVVRGIVSEDKFRNYEDRMEVLNLKALGAIWCPNPHVPEAAKTTDASSPRSASTNSALTSRARSWTALGAT